MRTWMPQQWRCVKQRRFQFSSLARCCKRVARPTPSRSDQYNHWFDIGTAAAIWRDHHHLALAACPSRARGIRKRCLRYRVARRAAPLSLPRAAQAQTRIVSGRLCRMRDARAPLDELPGSLQANGAKIVEWRHSTVLTNNRSNGAQSRGLRTPLRALSSRARGAALMASCTLCTAAARMSPMR